MTPRIRKALPPSYLASGGTIPDGEFLTSEDDFGCAIRENPAIPVPPNVPKNLSWGEVISYALRQPIVAQKLGLVYSLEITLPTNQAQALAQGGYVFVKLAPSDPWAVAAASAAGSIRTHAARIPALDTTPRAVFGAFQFVTDGGGTPLDTSILAAQTYADGFAKLVHTSQPTNVEAAIGDGTLPPASDLGIQIGWDDAQVVAWHNDQLALLASRRAGTLTTAQQTPLGIGGYRVDVSDVTPAQAGAPPQTPTQWQSLTQVTTTLPANLGTFTGELAIEPMATRPASPMGGEAWLPRYFATWRGGSLCEADPIPQALTSRGTPHPIRQSAYGLTTLLSYGHTYAFRVRLMDLSGGGPTIAHHDAPLDPDPDSIAIQSFQRLVPPKAPQVTFTVPTGGVQSTPSALTVLRPLIGYPEVLYTALGNTAAARDAIRAKLVAQAGAQAKLVGLPDPDVDHVRITVAIRHPLHDEGTDNGPFVQLYTTTRTLNSVTGTVPSQTDPGTLVDIVYVDAPNILGWAPTQPSSGPLLLPRGRDIQVSVQAGLRADPGAYFAATIASGHSATFALRCEPVAEPALLQQADTLPPIVGCYFRRPVDVAAPPLIEQLANQLGVQSSGQATLVTPAGERIVFAVSRALRATISSDGETLTFATTDELTRFWIVALTVDLERDWTWTGLNQPSLNILRGTTSDTEATATPIGSVTIPRVLGASATSQPSTVARGRTRIIFLDAIDPHEATGSFPQALVHRWFIQPHQTASGPVAVSPIPTPSYVPNAPPAISGAGLENTPLDLTLPIAIPPAQVPELASVGLALSAYQPGEAYASTEPRMRALWLELKAPIANSVGDALFARVLAHGADPILYDAPAVAVANANPPLPLDPELLRVRGSERYGRPGRG